jgi:hypothetical protein
VIVFNRNILIIDNHGLPDHRPSKINLTLELLQRNFGLIDNDIDHTLSFNAMKGKDYVKIYHHLHFSCTYGMRTAD